MSSVAVSAVVATIFVVAVLSVVVYALFKMSPFAHHADVFHGRERQQSPRLD